MADRNRPSPTRALAMRVLYHIHKVLAESDGFVRKTEVEQRLLSDLEFSDWETAPAGKTGRPRWRNTFWYTTDAVKAGFLQKSRGRWKITEEGRRVLERGPEALLDAAIQGYRDFQANKDDTEDDSSNAGLGAPARGQILRDGLKLLERTAGRSLPWEALLNRLPSLLPEDLTEQLDAHDSEWVRNYGYRTFHRATRAGWLDRNAGQWSLTESGVRALQEWPESKELWQKAKQAAGTSSEKERIPYLGSTADLGRVPQALYRSQSATISQLVGDIQQGTLALPDIQRPFVWKNTKVRDLLDSLFRGYPFGFILTWKNPVEASTKQIGAGPKGGALPHALVIDGQQRLTSLFAVLSGHAIVDDNFKERHIRIGFHPIQGAFAVADAALQNNPEWLPDVSLVFTDRMGALSVVRAYLDRLKTAREITPDHERAIEANIQRLVNLTNLPVSVLEIGVDAEEEQVAEIFVRINSKGQNLRQADFILTLLAVFWEEGREALEDFSRACQIPSADGRASPFNHKLRPGPDDLIRVGIAVGHRRARLSAAYQILRGKDTRTGVITDEARHKNIGKLEDAQTSQARRG